MKTARLKLASHLTRGAWIETASASSRSTSSTRRTSHEVRGLNPPIFERPDGLSTSHLTRGAWIETPVPLVRW
ncbi:hypothetical protein HMPREF3038_03193 [Akkermansia sp. KLE1797]|nr:hypothetical protein HMPREF3038_03193 [Akkermansia sp. KLE1797]